MAIWPYMEQNEQNDVQKRVTTPSENRTPTVTVQRVLMSFYEKASQQGGTMVMKFIGGIIIRVTEIYKVT